MLQSTSVIVSQAVAPVTQEPTPAQALAMLPRCKLRERHRARALVAALQRYLTVCAERRDIELRASEARTAWPVRGNGSGVAA